MSLARILTPYGKNGAGLDTDVIIYKEILEKAGFSVVVQLAANTWMLHQEPIVTVNLFLEDINSAWLVKGRYNIFMINQEIYHDCSMYGHLDCIIVKTRYAQRLMEDFKRKNHYSFYILYTKHTSKDIYLPNIEKDYQQVIHAPGKSPYKNTLHVLNAWAEHPEWPLLHVVARPDKLPYIMNFQNHPNIRIHSKRLSNQELGELQSKCGLHICTSISEGWGHYLNEARSSGGVVMSTDAAPMNELVTVETGILVPTSSHTTKQFVIGPIEFNYIDTASIEKGMSHYKSLSWMEKIQMGQASRAAYEEDTRFFQVTLLHYFQSINPQTTGIYLTARDTPISQRWGQFELSAKKCTKFVNFKYCISNISIAFIVVIVSTILYLVFHKKKRN